MARVLPKITVDELRKTGRAKTKRYRMVTVHFCDIEGFEFTQTAQKLRDVSVAEQLKKIYWKKFICPDKVDISYCSDDLK